MKTITIAISDSTYDYIKRRATTCVECRAAAMLDMSVEAQIEIEKRNEEGAE